MVTTSRAAHRAAALWCALAADRLLGEPPGPLHPVAAFGRGMTRLERTMWADRRGRGIAYAAAGTGLAAAVGSLASTGGPRRRLAAVVAATYVAVAAQGLVAAADDVATALRSGDLHGARRLLRSLVGRDTTILDEHEIIRAVVESVAENTVDAVTAPLFWALVAGAPGVLAYRAVNTLDAMVGHHSSRYERFGWAAARADDVANWLPARLTTVAVAAVRPRRAASIARAVREQAPSHPSPNAGVIEAAFAAAMGVRLGGVNDYGGRMESRPLLGDGARPEDRHIVEACRLSRQATLALCAAATIVAVASTIGTRATTSGGHR